MKIIALLILFTLSACGGVTVSDTPLNLTGPAFEGMIMSSDGEDNAEISFNLVQALDNTISGTVFFEESDCLINGLIDSSQSSVNGFSVRIVVTQFEVSDEGVEDGEEVSQNGEVTFFLTLDGNTLTGTYNVSGPTVCDQIMGSGTVNASR